MSLEYPGNSTPIVVIAIRRIVVITIRTTCVERFIVKRPAAQTAGNELGRTAINVVPKTRLYNSANRFKTVGELDHKPLQFGFPKIFRALATLARL